MIEPWLYPTLTAVAALTGFIDSIAGGGGLITVPALLLSLYQIQQKYLHHLFQKHFHWI